MKLNYNTLSDIKGYAITTLITLGISVVFCVVYVNHNVSSLERRYVVVNTDAISKQFLSVIIRANLPDEKYKHLLIAYDTKLSEVINKVSLQNNFVILKKGSVLTELPDVTADIQSITFGELNLDELLNA
jgi:hypothetical protein